MTKHRSEARGGTRPPGARPGRGKTRGKPANQAGRPTAAELERRKAKVMEVATDLFVHQGYSATSLVDIAKGAGVATRTLYQHFGDKEAMFRDVIFARDTGAVAVPPVLQPGDTLFAALMRTADYMHEFSLRPRSIDLMRLMIAESKRFPDLIRGVATATFAKFRRTLAKVFESLAQAGLIPESNYARLAELYVDLVLGTMPIMTYAEWTNAPPTEEDIAERVDLFILGAFGAAVARRSRTRTAKVVSSGTHVAAADDDDVLATAAQ